MGTSPILRVATLNFGGEAARHGQWHERLARIGRALSSARVDIVVAQAVFDEQAGEEPLATVRAALPELSRAGYAPIGDPADGIGLAVLSRDPLTSIQTVALPAPSDPDDMTQRRLLHACIGDGERSLHILNAYFSWVEGQARECIETSLTLAASLDGDVLLAGDFNQVPQSAALAPLRNARWTDLWAALEANDTGFTFETGKLWGRIDQLWARGDLAARARSAWLIGGEGEAALSDHRGIVVEFAA